MKAKGSGIDCALMITGMALEQITQQGLVEDIKFMPLLRKCFPHMRSLIRMRMIMTIVAILIAIIVTIMMVIMTIRSPQSARTSIAPRRCAAWSWLAESRHCRNHSWCAAWSLRGSKLKSLR